MKPVLACTAILALLASPLQAQRSVHGVVFNDANGNGVFDATERPLPGVVVSNQSEVVTTDAAGRYQLPAGEKTIVFVSVPTDWQTVGSWWQTVGGSDSISFALRSEQQPRSFRFIHASDPHIRPSNVQRVRRFRELADSLDPAMTLITGDLVYDAMSQQEPQARSFFELFRAEMTLHAPFWTIPGNHDHFGIIPSRSHVPSTHPLYNRGMYRLYRGPEYYSFNFGGVHFIGLDTVQPDDSAYYGGVDSVQLAWLTRDVAAVPASTPIVVYCHIPLATGVETMAGYLEMALVSSVAHPKGGTSFRHSVANTLAVLGAFKGRPQPLLLGGHMHVAEKIVYQTDHGPLRFEQTAAIVGPNDYGPVIMQSGFTLYNVSNGVIDAGTFVPLTMPEG
ncbi:MAG TPA: metallophosphoesterase [Gemmatimonadaceae bacterium]|nr:metallophosphoesterase [Gemmatimonadaceae bacterium]